VGTYKSMNLEKLKQHMSGMDKSFTLTIVSLLVMELHLNFFGDRADSGRVFVTGLKLEPRDDSTPLFFLTRLSYY